MSDFLWPYGLYPARLLYPWNSPSKNTVVGSHFLLQGIFLTQGSNSHLLRCRQILYCLSHQGSPVITSSRGIIWFKSTQERFWFGNTESTISKNSLKRPYGKCCVVRSKTEDAHWVPPLSRHLRTSGRRREGLSNHISTFRMFLS